MIDDGRTMASYHVPPVRTGRHTQRHFVCLTPLVRAVQGFYDGPIIQPPPRVLPAGHPPTHRIIQSFLFPHAEPPSPAPRFRAASASSPLRRPSSYAGPPTPTAPTGTRHPPRGRASALLSDCVYGAAGRPTGQQHLLEQDLRPVPDWNPKC